MRPRPEKKYKEPRTPKRRRVSDIVYLMTILTAFEIIGIAMLVFPRSTESITEKRELKNSRSFPRKAGSAGNSPREYPSGSAIRFPPATR